MWKNFQKTKIHCILQWTVNTWTYITVSHCVYPTICEMGVNSGLRLIVIVIVIICHFTSWHCFGSAKKVHFLCSRFVQRYATFFSQEWHSDFGLFGYNIGNLYLLFLNTNHTNKFYESSCRHENESHEFIEVSYNRRSAHATLPLCLRFAFAPKVEAKCNQIGMKPPSTSPIHLTDEPFFT